jgi:hypothetical protein
MIAKILIFSLITIFFYETGGYLEMLLIGRRSSSELGECAFLISYFVLIYFAIRADNIRYKSICLIIPLLAILLAFASYPSLDEYVNTKRIVKLSHVLFRSTYCYYLYLASGIVSIFLAERFSGKRLTSDGASQGSIAP